MTASFPVPDIVLKDLNATKVRDVLRPVSEALELAHGVDATSLCACLIDAEAMGGSTIGQGIAVISARVPQAVSLRRLAAFVTLKRAVAFKGVANHACDIVFVLVSPDHQAQAHLRDLSAVIRALRDQDFADRLRAAPNAERTSGLFRAREMAMIKAA